MLTRGRADRQLAYRSGQHTVITDDFAHVGNSFAEHRMVQQHAERSAHRSACRGDAIVGSLAFRTELLALDVCNPLHEPS